MSKAQEKGTPARILDSLASLKLTLFIFFTLAAASVVGTLLPQGTGPGELEGHFSPAMASLIETLGLNNLYHTSWFRMLLLLLCINLLVCTLDRLPKTIKLIRRQEEPFDSNKLSKFGNSAVISTKLSALEAEQVLQQAVSETFGPLRKLEMPGHYRGMVEKGRWSRLMVYGVHISVLLVIFGALLGSKIGFKGFMNLPEGSVSNEVVLAGGQSFITLPFQVKCEKFEVSYYDTGAPKEFRSDLAILDKDREVLKQPIVVNDPLTYDGVTFYQASYGTMLREAELELTERDTGKTATLTVPYHGTLTIPGTSDVISITNFQENLMRFGPALGIAIAKKGNESEASGSWVLADRPKFHGNTIQNYQIRVLNMSKVNYTGLQVKRDPGVWLVYIGFTLMLIGICLTFYSSHKKVWAVIEPDQKGKTTIIAVAGRTNRNSPGFSEKFEDLASRLNARLTPQKMKEDKKKK